MKTTLLLFVSILAIALFAPILIGQDKYFLDLTQPSELPLPARTGFGCGPRLSAGEGAGPVRPSPDILLEVVSFDKSTYFLGEDFVGQIRIKNIGGQPIRIPWSPNSDYRNKDCTGGVKDTNKASLGSSLVLVFTSVSGVGRELLVKGLYGRLAIPKTFRVLAPGESARVKFRGRLAFSNPRSEEPSGSSFGLPQDFVVTAAYDLDDTSQGNPYATVNSSNRVKVRIERTPPQPK